MLSFQIHRPFPFSTTICCVHVCCGGVHDSVYGFGKPRTNGLQVHCIQPIGWCVWGRRKFRAALFWFGNSTCYICHRRCRRCSAACCVYISTCATSCPHWHERHSFGSGIIWFVGCTIVLQAMLCLSNVSVVTCACLLDNVIVHVRRHFSRDDKYMVPSVAVVCVRFRRLALYGQ